MDRADDIEIDDDLAEYVVYDAPSVIKYQFNLQYSLLHQFTSALSCLHVALKYLWMIIVSITKMTSSSMLVVVVRILMAMR